VPEPEAPPLHGVRRRDRSEEPHRFAAFQSMGRLGDWAISAVGVAARRFRSMTVSGCGRASSGCATTSAPGVRGLPLCLGLRARPKSNPAALPPIAVSMATWARRSRCRRPAKVGGRPRRFVIEPSRETTSERSHLTCSGGQNVGSLASTEAGIGRRRGVVSQRRYHSRSTGAAD